MNNTFRRDFTSETKRRIDKNKKALGIVLAAILLTMAFVAMAPAVAAQPIIVDGNNSDWEGLAGVQCVSDGFGDIYIVNKTPFVNGYDILEFCMFYDVANDTIYFKFDVAGVPGDTDGDGDPNDTSDPDNITDSFEVGPNDAYKALIDLDADPSVDFRLSYRNNTVFMKVGFSDDTIVPGTTAGSIGPPYSNDTIVEMSYYPLHNLTGFGECNDFEIRGWAGSQEEGLGEDDTSDLLLNEVPEPIIITENVCFCNNVTFNGSASYDPDGTITNWTWDFGDGYFDYGPIVEHHYDEPGEYAVTLSVTDDFNAVCSNTTTNVTVWENPIANFTAPPVCNGTTTQFTDTSTNGSGNITNWTWNFGDNTSLNYTQHPAHTYAAAGNYTVTLNITDENNCTNTTSKNVTVWENPEANFTFVNTCFCTNVTFTDTSVEGDANIAVRSWQFGDGNVSTATNPTWHYAAPGKYEVNLTVTDEHGCNDTISKWVQVYANPEANFSFNNTCFCT
ncbi:MAG: PKD domain-containing protein, partial [Methanomicrobia archaeon]|nr:PKD domain-containing protein [Methanomicrobia archaeon]